MYLEGIQKYNCFFMINGPYDRACEDVAHVGRACDCQEMGAYIQILKEIMLAVLIKRL